MSYEIPGLTRTDIEMLKELIALELYDLSQEKEEERDTEQIKYLRELFDKLGKDRDNGL